MAVRFPDIPQTVDPAEIHVNYFFDHLTACVKFGHTPGKLWCPHAVTVDSNSNQIYVVEGLYLPEGFRNIARVSIFLETGEFLNTFSLQHMKDPYGIAIHRDNVYVTDIVEHSVFHFKVEDFRFVTRVGGRGSGVGQFDQPCQLAVSTNRDLFVADRDNNRVQILGSDLRYQRHISHHSMRYPSDVKLTTDEVFVLCRTSPCVKVFSYPGELIRSLVTYGSIGMQVIEPSFFCLDANSNLLLSDWHDHRIKIFSREGALLHTLGEQGHGVGMFYVPKGIAITNNLKLVVVSNNSTVELG